MSVRENVPSHDNAMAEKQKCRAKLLMQISLNWTLMHVPPANIVPLTLTNYGSGYGYPIGTNSPGVIQVPTNFRSEDELLQYLVA